MGKVMEIHTPLCPSWTFLSCKLREKLTEATITTSNCTLTSIDMNYARKDPGLLSGAWLFAFPHVNQTVDKRLLECMWFWLNVTGVLRSNKVIGVQGQKQRRWQPFRGFLRVCNHQVACVPRYNPAEILIPASGTYEQRH